MTGPGHLSGVVLAGGSGRRLGGPKALIPLAGTTLVERAVGALAMRCDEVVVVTRPEVGLGDPGAPVIYDGPGPDAPLTGIASGLAAVAGDEVLVLACDLPFAGAALDELLAGTPGTPAMATAAGRAQPLCGRYPRRAALRVARRLLASGSARALSFAEALGSVHVPVSPTSLLNVNSRSDLRRASVALALRDAASAIRDMSPSSGRAGAACPCGKSLGVPRGAQ